MRPGSPRSEFYGNRGGVLLKKAPQQGCEKAEEEQDGGGPPHPADAFRPHATTEFPSGEFLVVEILLRQIESAGGVGVLAPAGEMVCAAFRAGLRPAGHLLAADRADLWRWFHAVRAGLPYLPEV